MIRASWHLPIPVLPRATNPAEPVRASRPHAALVGVSLLLAAALLAPTASASPPKHLRSESKTAASGQATRLVRTGDDLDVQTGNLRLTDAARGRLERIAARFHKVTKRRLVITGGSRTPTRQAELMHEKLDHGDNLMALYEKPLAAEIQAAYRDAVKRHFAKPKQIVAIREVIVAQIKRGLYVSRHLQAGAADVRSINMTPARVQAFRAAVAAEPGVVLLDERDAAEQHFHLSL
ncbi:MAG: hypothetical protein ABJE95_06590 [Byssovorax sp.]